MLLPVFRVCLVDKQNLWCLVVMRWETLVVFVTLDIATCAFILEVLSIYIVHLLLMCRHSNMFVPQSYLVAYNIWFCHLSCLTKKNGKKKKKRTSHTS